MPCPCGSGNSYAQCCQPVHDGVLLAANPEQLMRARYSAYALGNERFVFTSWHPKTRPDDVSSQGIRWTGLEIIDASDDQVEFIASYIDEAAGEAGKLHERSQFVVRAGRWMYLEPIILD